MLTVLLAICVLLLLNTRVHGLEPVGSISQNTNEPVKVRIKDITRISSIYDTQLYGYGIIVGLNGTGDSAGARFTMQSIINMLQREGIDVSGSKISVKNVAAVMLTANLPFFAERGDRIDIMVSSIGDAKSLSGGILLPSPLKGPDGQLYVLAQGSVLVGGFSASGGGGSSSQKNHPTVGNMPNGGIIQRIPPHLEQNYDYSSGLGLSIREPDFTTATRVASAINNEFPGSAQAMDAATIKISIPESEADAVAFISRLENLTLVPDYMAVVVINERTGTIVIGNDVRITPVAVAHGNLNIQIMAAEEVSQPPPMTDGATVIATQEDITVQEEKKSMHVMRGGATIDELVGALNLIGVSPRDMIGILQTIKKAGALHARLEIE